MDTEILYVNLVKIRPRKASQCSFQLKIMIRKYRTHTGFKISPLSTCNTRDNTITSIKPANLILVGFKLKPIYRTCVHAGILKRQTGCISF